MIIIGVAGIPSRCKDIFNGLEFLHENSLSEELEFVRGVWLSGEKLVDVKEFNKKLKVPLSIHAPYYINLNSDKQETVDKSRLWIYLCAKVAFELGASPVVFHAGFRTKPCYIDNVKVEILKILDKMKENGIKTNLAPETMGNPAKFGTIDEVRELSEIKGVEPCIDFGHINALCQGCLKSVDDFKALINEFKQDKLHCHYSSVNFGPKGEKNNMSGLSNPPFKLLVEAIRELRKEFNIICESPLLENDALKMQQLVKSIMG